MDQSILDPAETEWTNVTISSSFGFYRVVKYLHQDPRDNLNDPFQVFRCLPYKSDKALYGVICA
jgi:hypothetical protein